MSAFGAGGRSVNSGLHSSHEKQRHPHGGSHVSSTPLDQYQKKCSSINDEILSQHSLRSATQNSYHNGAGSDDIHYEPVLEKALVKKQSVVTDGRPPRANKKRDDEVGKVSDGSGLNMSNNISGNSFSNASVSSKRVKK